MIKNSLLSKFPRWYTELDPQKHYLVLSNDFDSYYSCKVLMTMFNLEIGGFYEFNSGLWLNREKTDGKRPIFVDLSVTRGMTFDNHMTFIENPLAINPNIDTTSYFKKYNGSTLALICALYGYEVTDEKRLTSLLCIDGWYYGYYNKDGKYKNINIEWLEALGMKDKLLPILENHDKDYFINFIKKYKLNEAITIKNNRLQCAVKMALPEYEFELTFPVSNRHISKAELQEIYQNSPKRIVTSAETYKDQYIYNERVS